MRRGTIRVFLATAATLVVTGCAPVTPDPSGIQLTGAVYTDFRVDLPCVEQTGPRELAGIGLVFRDRAGVLLGRTRTGVVQGEELPSRGEEELGGCRFLAPYAVILPTTHTYTVEFEVPDPPNPRVAYFSGTDELSTQTISLSDLVDAGFTWSFETPPSFVVP